MKLPPVCANFELAVLGIEAPGPRGVNQRVEIVAALSQALLEVEPGGGVDRRSGQGIEQCTEALVGLFQAAGILARRKNVLVASQHQCVGVQREIARFLGRLLRPVGGVARGHVPRCNNSVIYPAAYK